MPHTDEHRAGEGASGLLDRVSWVILVLAVALALTAGVLRRLQSPPEAPPASIREAFPGAVVFRAAHGPFEHYRALGADGRNLGIVFLTDRVSPSVNGYNGPIRLAVGVSADGGLTGVVPYQHGETPYYFRMVMESGLLSELTSADTRSPGWAPDAVSGATVSSKAIIREAALGAALNLSPPLAPKPAPPWSRPETVRWPWTEAMLVLVLSAALVLARRKSGELVREGFMILALLVVGAWLNTPLTLSALSGLLSLRLPGMENPLLLILFLFTAVSIPITGRGYCRLVCPFGVMQHFLHRLSPSRIRPPASLAAFLPAARRLFAAFCLAVITLAGLTGFAGAEPFFALFSFRLSSLGWFFVTVILLVSVVWQRFWCNSLCPTGTLLACACRLAAPGRGKRDESI